MKNNARELKFGKDIQHKYGQEPLLSSKHECEGQGGFESFSILDQIIFYDHGLHLSN